MTRTPDGPQGLGPRLTEARRQAGLSVSAASAAAGLDEQVLVDLEQDRRRPTADQLAELSEVYGTDLQGLLVPRRPVEFHAATGTLVIDGVRQRRVPHTADGVHEAYLALLYAVRGARRGEELPLRASDVEALLEVVGDDPDRLAERLVELMHCSPDEAVLLRRVLLRHRALTAAAGVAVGVSLVALVGLGGSGEPAGASSGGPVTSSVVTVDGEAEAPLTGSTRSASTDPRTDEERAAFEAADPEPAPDVEPVDEPLADPALFDEPTSPTTPSDGDATPLSGRSDLLP